ncbi:MAG: hypothetical protein ACPHQP_09255 [Longimicrobiales bacterium]
MALTPTLLLDVRDRARGCAAGLLILAMSACATTANRATTPTAEAGVVGSYTGYFVFDGEQFRSTLQLRSSAPGRVAGAFRVSQPIEIEGVASGMVIDDLLRITVTWRSPDGCAGTIEGILSITEHGNAIDGPIAVSDCGAPVAGRMTFFRSDRIPETPAWVVRSDKAR